MEYRLLGGTGISVSRLCFGSLTVGPLQANLDEEAASDILVRAIELGVNFVDTAELYRTMPIIRRAMQKTGTRDLVVGTKSYAFSAETAEKSLRKALLELDRDYVDLFLIHEQESDLTLKGHWEAIEWFIRRKEIGDIRATGISTHHVAAASAFLKYPELDVIHPLVNRSGLGIQDGTADDMVAVLKAAKASGRGIYGMKPLGGGNLIASAEDCLNYVLDLDCLDSIALGMRYADEVDANVAFFDRRRFPDALQESLRTKTRRLMVHDWCTKCGNCIPKCSAGALSLGEKTVEVDSAKCILCGYCSAACPEFCLKVI